MVAKGYEDASTIGRGYDASYSFDVYDGVDHSPCCADPDAEVPVPLDVDLETGLFDEITGTFDGQRAVVFSEVASDGCILVGLRFFNCSSRKTRGTYEFIHSDNIDRILLVRDWFVNQLDK